MNYIFYLETKLPCCLYSTDVCSDHNCLFLMMHELHVCRNSAISCMDRLEAKRTTPMPCIQECPIIVFCHYLLCCIARCVYDRAA